MAGWLKVLLVILVIAALFYMIFVANELGSVPLPRVEMVKPENLAHIKGQEWPKGWGVGQADWFHHASQGTRILPYAWFVNLEKPTLIPSGRIVDPGYLERFGFLPSPVDPKLNPDGLPIGFAIEEDFDAPYADPPSTGKVVGLTCAACHTGQITYRDAADSNALKGILIEGGPAMINLSAFQETIGRAIGITLRFDTRFEQFARGVLDGQDLGVAEKAARKKELKAQLQRFFDAGMASREYARIHKLNGTDGGFGRTDALGLIGNRVFVALGNENLTVPSGPVNFPPLWDTPWFDWVQYNASIRMPMVRNIGEALGVGAPVNLDEEPADIAKNRDTPLFASTVNVRNLHLMERQIGGEKELDGLKSPKLQETALWDASPQAENLRVAGHLLYRERCQDCHLPPIKDLKDDLENKEFWSVEEVSGKHILRLKTFDLQEIGTDPNQAMNFYRRVAVFEGTTTSAARGLYAVTEFIRSDAYRKMGLTGDQILDFNRYRQFDGMPPDQGGSPKTQADYAADVMSGKFIDQVLVANLSYKARPLDGVWATPPYLHNGSVPNLRQMLMPAASRDRTFYLGSTLYDRDRVGFATERFAGAFLLDTTLPGNSNAGHEYRNLSLQELERARGIAYPSPAETPSSRTRWSTVLNLTESAFDKLTPSERWRRIRDATDAALKLDWVKRDHPFKGVLGPEFDDDERDKLLEYLKSL
ncbi:di-heme-cytochrome C peroxidase [Tundrisphaera sp. TA3]|uniref:di-heme-cytochrome C peroxidase n=1 Tax=Tundrisphaera sp. TA3 TaxID=3435775 RepID=UPI003EC1433E